MIRSKLNQIKNNIANSITIVAVSKTKPASDIMELYNHGQFQYGENKIILMYFWCFDLRVIRL